MSWDTMPSLLQSIYWLQTHQWAFWILVNLSAYLAYWVSRYTAIGIFGVVYPFASSACTVTFASEWWMGSIGIVTILAALAPYFITAWRDKGKGARNNVGTQ